MAELSGDDVERLASRLAMMVSEEGEAANAGRAVAQLARRLGLTGGELKELFLNGAASGLARPPPPAAPREEIDALEREISTLRKGLRLMEANCRDLEYERDALFSELASLQNLADNARSASRLRYALIGVLVLALAGAGSVGFLMSVDESTRPLPNGPPRADLLVPAPGPAAKPAASASPNYGPVARRVGIVRNGRAVAYRAPDRNASAVATLQPGMPVVVRRVFFNVDTDWAEVEVGSVLGYVLTTDIDLS